MVSLTVLAQPINHGSRACNIYIQKFHFCKAEEGKNNTVRNICCNTNSESACTYFTQDA